MEHRAFANRMRRTPLSMAAQLLWYKLMDLANSLRWPEHFALDNSRLCAMINTKSRTTTIAARQELIDGGYLDFTPGIKGRPSTYHLRSVEEMEGWQPPPDDLEGDFLAEFKEDPTSYFGYTEALGVELAETTAHLWEEFFPGKTLGHTMRSGRSFRSWSSTMMRKQMSGLYRSRRKTRSCWATPLNRAGSAESSFGGTLRASCEILETVALKP